MIKIPQIIFLLLVSCSWAQTWQWTGRTHGELDWTTLETENFRIHHHQGIESIAREGASLAEQVLPTLLKQMDLEEIPTIDIIFTTEDEIMNGFALWTYTTFIWVDQNDAAIWLEDEKWLYQVLSHELQHIVFFHKVKTWMPEPWSFLYSSIPGWVVEGLAEYETERWRPFRADISHKFHVLKNKMEKMDPHHDGYSKLLYWSEKYGDSTIVKTLAERNSLGLLKFPMAFKKHTGVTVEDFNEDWRRHMNTYYYGYRAQKEAIDEIGKVVTLPLKKVNTFHFYKDSTQIAIVGRDDENQFDQSLFIIQRDTTEERKLKAKRRKAEKKEKLKTENGIGFFTKLFGKDKKDEKEKKPKPILIWDKNEVDYGKFHRTLQWSTDGRKVLYSKYHFGENQSMVYDVKMYDLDTEKSTWLTQSMRATYADWSPDGDKVVFVAHENSIANLFTMNLDGSHKNQITDYTYDTQILNPHFSPDGNSIAFAMADQSANLDLFLLDVESSEITRLTTDPAADYDPVWHPGGDYISYTSHAGSTPNIHTLNISNGETKQVSDVGDAVWAKQWSPVDSTLMVTTLPDADTVRIANVNPHREITTKELVLREKYTRWRNVEPVHLLTGIDPQKAVEVLKEHDYSPILGFKHFMSLALPMDMGIVGLTQWVDPMIRHIIFATGYAGFNEDEPTRFLLQYIHAVNGPIWSVIYSSLMDFTAKPYDRSKFGLWEENSSVSFNASLPLNSGNYMSSTHYLGSAISFTDRNAMIISGTDQEDELLTQDTTRYLPMPISGKEGLVSLSYTWLNRRPHKQNSLVPFRGYGMRFGIDHANSNLFGKFDYSRFSSDAFVNIPIKKTAFYFRIKTVMLTGDNPVPQDMPAFTDDTPIYLGGKNTFGMQEVINPRGWTGWRTGDRLVFGSAEYRVGSEKFSLALISDFGNVWNSNSQGIPEPIMTAGYEIRTMIIGFAIALGQANEPDNWSQDNTQPETYFRLTLVNPF